MLRLVSELYESATTTAIIRTARRYGEEQLGLTLEKEATYIEANKEE
jgi:hypothetical protein